MIFTVKNATLEQIQALVAAYKSRVTVNGSAEKPYISVKMIKGEKTVDLMKNVVEIMYNNRENKEAH